MIYIISAFVFFIFSLSLLIAYIYCYNMFPNNEQVNKDKDLIVFFMLISMFLAGLNIAGFCQQRNIDKQYTTIINYYHRNVNQVQKEQQ